jgi:RNA polymerase sigma-70 factor (family 1)
MSQFPEDKLIIKELKKGDVLAFDLIFNKYHKKVYHFSLSYLKNKEDAEDVVQEVFMNIWKFRDQINDYYVFSKYIFKITYNTTCKKFRKRASDKRQMEEVFKDVLFEDNSTNLEIEYDNLLNTTSLLIERLPPRQKRIFLLKFNNQMDSEQIAKQLNISKKTVENYLAKAKKSLRCSLAAEHILSVLFFWLFIK